MKPNSLVNQQGNGTNPHWFDSGTQQCIVCKTDRRQDEWKVGGCKSLQEIKREFGVQYRNLDAEWEDMKHLCENSNGEICSYPHPNLGRIWEIIDRDIVGALCHNHVGQLDDITTPYDAVLERGDERFRVLLKE